MKSELHRRADELLERLWTICDERKEDNEKMSQSLMKVRLMLFSAFQILNSKLLKEIFFLSILSKSLDEDMSLPYLFEL